MSARSTAAAVLASAGILAAGWAAGTANGATVAVPAATNSDTSSSQASSATPSASSATPSVTSATPSASSATPSATPSTSSSTKSATPSKSATTAAAGITGTYTGSTAQHRYGSVTVTVTLSNGKITNVTATVVDDGQSKSKAINSSAVPTIKARVLAANSANVNTVSGATYTTDAYLTSLQSALSKAGFTG